MRALASLVASQYALEELTAAGKTRTYARVTRGKSVTCTASLSHWHAIPSLFRHMHGRDLSILVQGKHATTCISVAAGHLP